jgi:hypothetical protein
MKLRWIQDERKKTCVLCKQKFEGHGNNPAPLLEEGRCCDDCNVNTIIPVRVMEEVIGRPISSIPDDIILFDAEEAQKRRLMKSIYKDASDNTGTQIINIEQHNPDSLDK